MSLVRILNICCLILTVFCCTSCEQDRGVGKVQATTSTQIGDYHAFLIYVEDYEDTSLAKLEFPGADARKLKGVLESKYKFEPIDLIENPTDSELQDLFESLQRIPESDNVLIFFAGHGEYDFEKEEGYWLPKNAYTFTNSFSNSELREAIKGMQAKHVLIISDTCFGGSILIDPHIFRSSLNAIEALYPYESRKAMTSSSTRIEPVPDKSVFLDHLVKKLEENNDEYLNASKLFLNIQEAVLNEVKKGPAPTPLYGRIGDVGDFGGHFFFILENADINGLNIRSVLSKDQQTFFFSLVLIGVWILVGFAVYTKNFDRRIGPLFLILITILLVYWGLSIFS